MMKIVCPRCSAPPEPEAQDSKELLQGDGTKLDIVKKRMIWTGLNVALNMRCLAMLAAAEVERPGRNVSRMT